MNISIYIGKKETLKDQALLALFEKLENAGCSMKILPICFLVLGETAPSFLRPDWLLKEGYL